MLFPINGALWITYPRESKTVAIISYNINNYHLVFVKKYSYSWELTFHLETQDYIDLLDYQTDYKVPHIHEDIT